MFIIEGAPSKSAHS